jgi:hypothetical protein
MENKQPFEFNNDTNIGFIDPFAGKPLDISGQTKTSIEWYDQELRKCMMGTESCDPIKILEQAKIMYQKEMEEQWNDGYMHGELGEDI